MKEEKVKTETADLTKKDKKSEKSEFGSHSVFKKPNTTTDSDDFVCPFSLMSIKELEKLKVDGLFDKPFRPFNPSNGLQPPVFNPLKAQAKTNDFPKFQPIKAENPSKKDQTKPKPIEPEIPLTKNQVETKSDLNSTQNSVIKIKFNN